MKAFGVAFALLLAVAGTAVWPAGLAARGWVPDLLLLVTVAAGLQGRGRTGFLVGVLAGLLAGPLSLEPFGWDAALLGSAGLVTASLRTYLRGDHPGVQAVLAGGLALALGGLRVLRLEMTEGEIALLGLVPLVFAGALATAALAPALVSGLDGLGAFRAPGERRFGRAV